MKSRVLFLVALGALSLESPAQTLVRSVSGPVAGANYGTACIVVSDQNSDGFKDVLVGAPGVNSLRGAVYCLSGAYLAVGSGTQTLWSSTPTLNQGDLYGSALLQIADATGDGVKDILVGRPGYDSTTANDLGAVCLLDGNTHSIVGLRYGATQGAELGRAMAIVSSNFVVVGAAGPLATSSRIHVASLSNLMGSGPLSVGISVGTSSTVALGAALSPGQDLDGDGNIEIVVGMPGLQSGAGGLTVYSMRPSGITFVLQNIGTYIPGVAGERMGSSLDAANDYDGDGFVDVVVGAPKALDGNGDEAGRVVVLSGAKLAAQTPPYEIRTFTLTSSIFTFFDRHFGAAVRACADLNGDGVGEILVGAPAYTSLAPLSNKGFVSIYSGASGERWAIIVGGSNEVLGDALGGALQDLNADGFKEFVLAGSLADTGGADAGVVKCYRLFPIAPSTYCAGKINSLGCTPSIGFSGSASMSSVAPFPITCANQINQKNGILFYGHAPNAAAFQGGLLCVTFPVRRTPVQNSGGSASGSDCTGTFSYNFTNRIRSGLDPTLVAGAEVYAQYWSRDAGSASGTSLSNALRFLIHP